MELISCSGLLCHTSSANGVSNTKAEVSPELHNFPVHASLLSAAFLVMIPLVYSKGVFHRGEQMRRLKDGNDHPGVHNWQFRTPHASPSSLLVYGRSVSARVLRNALSFTAIT